MLPSADGAVNGEPCSGNNLACSSQWLREQHLPIAETPNIISSLHSCGIGKAPSACAVCLFS
jgi:hypothetical protein